MNEVQDHDLLESEAKRVAKAIEQLQFAGQNLAERLESYTKSGGDAHSLVQANELFIRAVVRDCLTRLEVV